MTLLRLIAWWGVIGLAGVGLFAIVGLCIVAALKDEDDQ